MLMFGFELLYIVLSLFWIFSYLSWCWLGVASDSEFDMSWCWFDLICCELRWFGFMLMFISFVRVEFVWFDSIFGFIWCGYALDLYWSDVGVDVGFGLCWFGFDLIRFNFCLTRCWRLFDFVLVLNWFDLIWFDGALMLLLAWCDLACLDLIWFGLVLVRFDYDLFWFDFGCWFRFVFVVIWIHLILLDLIWF